MKTHWSNFSLVVPTLGFFTGLCLIFRRTTDGINFFSQLPDDTSTLPTLCRFFKKPQRQKGVAKPSQRFRRNFMTTSWEGDVCDLSVLHDIAEEDEDIY